MRPRCWVSARVPSPLSCSSVVAGAGAGAGSRRGVTWRVCCLTRSQPWLPLSTHPPARAGLSNTAGALPGVLGVTFAGYLLDKTGSWAHALFFPTAACQLFGLVIYSIFASSKRQGWD